MQVKKYRIESFEWAKIPVDLPKENLVLLVAKTSDPTIHPSDPEYPIRIFSPTELHEAARSLAKRIIGINHLRLPDGSPVLIEFSREEQQKIGQRFAFTVDANYNAETRCVETLLCLPKLYVNKIRRNYITQASVEYTWRDEKKTESGIEFIGLIFDKVDLLEDLPVGVTAGDRGTFFRLVESNRNLFEGGLAVAECKDCKGAGECDKCKECVPEPIQQHLVECPKCHERFEYQVSELPVNTMASEPAPLSAIESNVVNMETEKVLTESKSEPKKEEVKKVEAMPPTTPEVLVPPMPAQLEPTSVPEPLPTIVDAINITPVGNTTVVAPVTVMTPETQKLIESQTAKLAEQDKALVKLQESIKTKDAEKIKAVQDAVKVTKDILIKKVESVLPDSTIISRFNKGGQRLAEEIRKVVYEETKKD